MLGRIRQHKREQIDLIVREFLEKFQNGFAPHELIEISRAARLDLRMAARWEELINFPLEEPLEYWMCDERYQKRTVQGTSADDLDSGELVDPHRPDFPDDHLHALFDHKKRIAYVVRTPRNFRPRSNCFLRWQVAHIICHALLPWHGEMSYAESEGTISPVCDCEVEAEANYGAFRMLMPPETLRLQSDGGRAISFSIASQWAEKFGVPHEFALIAQVLEFGAESRPTVLHVTPKFRSHDTDLEAYILPVEFEMPAFAVQSESFRAGLASILSSI